MAPSQECSLVRCFGKVIKIAFVRAPNLECPIALSFDVFAKTIKIPFVWAPIGGSQDTLRREHPEACVKSMYFKAMKRLRRDAHSIWKKIC